MYVHVYDYTYAGNAATFQYDNLPYTYLLIHLPNKSVLNLGISYVFKYYACSLNSKVWLLKL